MVLLQSKYLNTCLLKFFMFPGKKSSFYFLCLNVILTHIIYLYIVYIVVVLNTLYVFFFQKVVLYPQVTQHPLWHAAKLKCNCISFFGFWLSISDHGRVGHTALATNWKSIFQQRKSLTFQGQSPPNKNKMEMATFL